MINAGTVAAYLTLDTSSFDAGINSAMSSISGFNTVSMLFKDAIDSMESMISSVGRFFIENLANPATETASTVLSRVGVMSSGLNAFTSSTASAALSFTSSWQLIPSAVTASKSTITSACSGIVSSALSALNKMPSSARSIMVQTGNGMVAGLAATQSAIFSKAQYIANTVASKIRAALGIHSPSRVMREIGRFTVDGMALGMSDNTDKIRQQASAAANTASDALSAVLRQINYGSTTNYGNPSAETNIGYKFGAPMSSAGNPESDLTVIAEKLDKCIRMISKKSTTLEIDGRSFGRLIREYSQEGSY